MEQRWISTPEENIFNTRLRYRLQFKKDISKHIYLKVFDEPFFDFKEANINQNRFFVGVGRTISPNVNIEIGYMKNHVGQNNYNRIRMVFLFKTNLYKKSKDNFASINQLSISQ